MLHADFWLCVYVSGPRCVCYRECFWLQMCLCDSGINYPNAEFEVTEKPVPASSSQSARPSRTQLTTVEVQQRL